VPQRSLSSWSAGARRRARAALDALRGRPPADPTPAPIRPSGWWDLLPFTTHRIMLAPGVATAPEGVDALGDVRLDLAVDACGGAIEGRTVVDLGCLEGGFTLAFAQRGARHALGIEAREVSVQRCELARSLLGIDTAEFVCGDIRDELGRRDRFDLVFAAGILYHVADPAMLLRAMRAACDGVALIDTHVADESAPSHGCSEVVTRRFGDRQYRGRMFPEYAPESSAAEVEEYLWAAWGDSDAFWPLEDELVRMILDAGFASAEKVEIDHVQRPRWGVDQTNRVVYLARVTR
jgi:SAM-dependent methyltransferase